MSGKFGAQLLAGKPENVCTPAALEAHMIHLPDATRAEIEVAVLENDELAEFLGGLRVVSAMSLEALREKIGDWVEAGDEIHHSCRK